MYNTITVCAKEIRIQGQALKVARLEADKYQFLDEPEKVVDALRAWRSRIDLFTFMQRLPDTTPRYSYPMEWDNLAAIRVTTFDEWWNSQIGFKARNKARQAQKKGVVVREVSFDRDLAKGIWNIYNECPVRQGRWFAHYGKDIETVYREEATFLDSSIFAGAYLNDQLIGFTKLVHDEARMQAGLMNIVSMIKHRDVAPTNALVAQAVQSCADRGISYLVYSNFSYGETQKSSIAEFKERCGFQRIDLPRYWVPLTRLGEIALRLGLHHRVADRIPRSLAVKLRRVREAWLDRKHQPLNGVG